MFYRIFSLYILVFTFTNFFNPSSVLADSETNNLSFVDSISCHNTNPKGLNNPSPITGTKVDCDLYISKNSDTDKFFSSNVRLRIGSVAQSPVCTKPDTSFGSYYITCKNTPVTGRVGFQTLKVNGKLIGKIKVENSVPSLVLNKIFHADDQKDPNDPNHSYTIEISTKNFKAGVNGYKIIVYPKDLKNPLKSKLTMENHEEYGIYMPIANFTRSQLLNDTNEVCAVVARYNQILPKTKSCKPLPPNVSNKQITSDIFSKSIVCPEFIDVSKGQTSLKCSLNLPEGSIKYDENYYGTKDGMSNELVNGADSGFIIGTTQTQFGKDFVGQDLGKCKLLDKEFSCEINPDKIKQNNLTLPYKASIGVMFSSFGADMSDYKIVKSVQIR